MSSSIPATSGIYRITCTVTGKFYIGSALNLRQRYTTHFGYLRQNEHHNRYVQAAWNKYGEDAFTFEILELVLPMFLTAREQYWFNKLKPFGKRGFNLAPIAGSSLGTVYSQEARQHISEAKRGQPRRGVKKTPEQIENHRRALTGYKHTEETKRRMGDSHRGSKRSPETREKMSQSAMGHAPTFTRVTWLISPDGEEFVVDNLTAFCIEHGLKPSGMSNAATGKRKQYKGWKARYID